MTNWEKSCVEALVASPAAFALFKAKQKNKKHVDQYLNKVWPYKIEKEFKSGDDNRNIIPKFKAATSCLAEGRIGEYVIYLKPRIRKEQLISIINRAKKITPPKVEIHNASFKIILHSNIGDTEAFNVYAFKDECPMTSMEYRISRLDGEFVEKIVFSTNRMYDSSLTHQEISKRIKPVLSHFLNQFSASSLSGRCNYKREYKGQNVGIEIEYDGQWQKYLHRHLNKSKNAISFNSGLDGGEQNLKGDKYHLIPRLRENRLRINGSRGLNALYTLLISMKNDGCTMTNKSGMHYHIDLTKKKGAEDDSNYSSKVDEIRKDLYDLAKKDWETISAIRNIFELDYIDPSHFVREIKYPTEFRTMEWRMGSQSLNFTKITIQILFSIHMSNAVFSKEKKIDIEYVKFLSSLITKINL